MKGDGMRRWVNGVLVVALCSAGVGIPSTRAGAQESRVTVKSTAPFGRVAEALELAVTDAFAEHQRLGEELKGNVTTFSSVVIKKFARIYAYLGWGSDDTILKIDLDPGEAEPELTETGRRRALDMSARKLPPAPPNVFRRPVRASRDEDDRKK